MIFTSTAFAIFLAVVYGLWLACRDRDALALGLLLVSSWIFYAHDHWQWLPLLLTYVLVDWIVALGIARSRRPQALLGLGLAFNLGVLAYWKCGPLLTGSAAQWVIPYGLSFYAFIGVAYLVDVYRRTVRAEPNLARFALFLSFFPHLIAGPILRAHELLARLQPDTMPARSRAPREAVFLLGRGAFKKTVVADRIAVAIDPFFLHLGSAPTQGVWSLPYIYLYAWQIYFDFSGYTDIARGVALLFGFRWPENFNLPYLAGSVRELWQRWHITLSLFLRDYLYIPLGGSRHGEWRTRANIMATFLLGGLWHGSNWTFVIWGGLHGIFLIVHRMWRASRVRASVVARNARWARWARAGSVVLTFHCVCIAWCFFRPAELHQSIACLRQVVVFDPDLLLSETLADASLIMLLATYGLAWLSAPARLTGALGIAQHAPAAAPPFARGFAWGLSVSLLTLAVLLAPQGERPFIYFQF